MNTSNVTLATIVTALFDLARLGVTPTDARIAGRLGISTERVRRAMRELDARGLADAKRCRLTLTGLGMGAQLDQERSERRDDAMLKAA